jgi:hypothetical protein
MMNSLPTLSAMFHNQLGGHLPQQGWSKWGEPVYGLLKEELDEWYCQVCGEKQVKVLPSYMFPMDELMRDYIRVCADCKSKANGTRVTFSWQLIKIIKHI